MTGRPDFVVVGAMRSGTSTLHRVLADHPAVFMVPRKEVRYFDRHYERGAAWYDACFDGSAPGQLTGEASPDYLYRTGALERLGRDLPWVRAVAILREPVARAYSHHQMGVARGREHRSFEQAVADELAGDPSTAYLARSRYAEQLERLFSHVAPERCHVLALEQLEREPAGALGGLCRFLGIDETAATLPRRPVNEYFRVRSATVRRWGRRLPGRGHDLVARLNHVRVAYPAPSDEVVAELRALLADDRRRTVELAGWRQDPWR